MKYGEIFLQLITGAHWVISFYQTRKNKQCTNNNSAKANNIFHVIEGLDSARYKAQKL
jgi:hypothetical protein